MPTNMTANSVTKKCPGIFSILTVLSIMGVKTGNKKKLIKDCLVFQSFLNLLSKNCTHISHTESSFPVNSINTLSKFGSVEWRVSTMFFFNKSQIIPHDINAAEIICDLLKKNMVETLHSTEPNLESVFMELTGKELSV